MAKPTLRQQIDALITEYDPIVKAAFLASIADIRSAITLRLLVERLERRDIEGALDALHIEREAFGPLDKAIRAAYDAGGTTTAGRMPKLFDRNGARIIVRFDSRNVRAEAWLREHSSTLVTNIVADQRQSIRGALETAMSQGRNPNKTAVDIVGRVNRISGKREGGLIGITRQQADFVATARQELLSGDPAQFRNYLTRNRRDKRFDAAVLKAIKDEKPLDAETVSRVVGRYSDRLLALRGEMLARTETLTSIHAAKFESFTQGLDKTEYPAEAVTRVWRSAGDTKVRHTHAAMNGQEALGLNAPFVSPSGAMLMFPGDTSLGAGADEIIGCRCDTDVRIDFSWGVT